jgi:hypothetical protein
MNTEYFWSNYTDDQILHALQRYLYNAYGFKKDERPEIAQPLLRNVYYACHPLEFLVDYGWENFRKSVWNTPEFFESIAYFDSRFMDKIKRLIDQSNPDESDLVCDYIIENQILLQFKTFEAVRYHRAKLEPILSELTVLIEESIREDDAIHIEQWKKD